MSAAVPALSPGLTVAIEEQQTAVWKLYALLECVTMALDANAPYDVEDADAALHAVLDLAREIHLRLDAGAIAQRAAAIQAPSDDRPPAGPRGIDELSRRRQRGEAQKPS